MKITKHISYFFIEERKQYLNKIIEETNKYKYSTDIFIHTNSKELKNADFVEYLNGKLTIIYHDLTNIHPYYLTWMCRDLMKIQINEYDIFVYIEDDILVPVNAIEYWLEHQEMMSKYNFNLGFLRIEVDTNNDEYVTDFTEGQYLTNVIELEGKKYCINDMNPYCAFWIYNKKEFNNFVDSKYYNINNIDGYMYREASAIGLHGAKTNWYKNTIIPIENEYICNDCKIFHLPNNYVNNYQNTFASIKFEKLLHP
jgi:hypothetical protein